MQIRAHVDLCKTSSDPATFHHSLRLRASMAIWMEFSMGNLHGYPPRVLCSCIAFSCVPRAAPVFSALHDLNGEICVIVIITLTARLSSSANAPRMAIIHDAQVSFLIGTMLRYSIHITTSPSLRSDVMGCAKNSGTLTSVCVFKKD